MTPSQPLSLLPPSSASADGLSSGYVFETERNTPFTTDAVNRLIKRIGERGRFRIGSAIAPYTARYTELSQERFKDFWRT